MKKLLIAVFLIGLTTVVNADNRKMFEQSLVEHNISYIITYENSTRMNVFEDTDPGSMCNIAASYNVLVDAVYNPAKGLSAMCDSFGAVSN